MPKSLAAKLRNANNCRVQYALWKLKVDIYKNHNRIQCKSSVEKLQNADCCRTLDVIDAQAGKNTEVLVEFNAKRLDAKL